MECLKLLQFRQRISLDKKTDQRKGYDILGLSDSGKITIAIDNFGLFTIHNAITIVNKLCSQCTLVFVLFVIKGIRTE